MDGYPRVGPAMQPRYNTIDEYIASVPKDVQKVLEAVRRTIRQTVPEAVEIISYGIPSVKLHGKGLLSFAAWKTHVSVYPKPAGPKAFEKKMAPYAREKSTVRFPLNEPIPHDLLAEIVELRKKDVLRKLRG